MENNRRTGRTTQIIERADHFACLGEYVLVVFPTVPMAKYAFDNISGIMNLEHRKMDMTVRYPSVDGVMRFISADQYWSNTVGRDSTRVFFDHTVSEMDGVKIGR